MATVGMSREEAQAFAELARARRYVVVNMFKGTQLKFGAKSAAATAKDLVSDGKDLVSNAKTLIKGGSKAASAIPADTLRAAAHDFIVQCADVHNISEVVAAITSEAVSNLVKEIIPFVGAAYSGFKLAKAAKAVAEDGYHLYRYSDYRGGFRMGDPQAAADAVRAIIRRELAKDSINLGQQSLATGAKIGGLFADFGTATNAAIGVANAVASLGLALYALGLDIKDWRAGNQRLAHPDDLDLTVFNDSPILGCYLLTCADTSSVANFFIADMGMPGWMDKVEQMKKTQMDPLLKVATQYINASKLQLEGLQSDKGTHQKKDFFARKRADAVAWLKKKVTA